MGGLPAGEDGGKKKLFGNDGGLNTLLVLSGVTTKDMLCSDDNTIAPNYYTDKLADLLCLNKVAA